MPLQLNFRIENRGGVMVLVTKGRTDDEELVRPATTAEVELWNAFTRRFTSPARESYIRVNEQDLVNVLMERDHLRRQVTSLEEKVRSLEAQMNPSAPREQEPETGSDQTGDDGSSSRC